MLGTMMFSAPCPTPVNGFEDRAWVDMARQNSFRPSLPLSRSDRLDQKRLPPACVRRAAPAAALRSTVGAPRVCRLPSRWLRRSRVFSRPAAMQSKCLSMASRQRDRPPQHRLKAAQVGPSRAAAPRRATVPGRSAPAPNRRLVLNQEVISPEQVPGRPNSPIAMASSRLGEYLAMWRVCVPNMFSGAVPQGLNCRAGRPSRPQGLVGR